MEDARDVWMLRWLEALRRDVAYGARMLRREPLFAFVAIATLAVGVTTTTTVFSITDAELWKPLAFPHPERLVSVWLQPPQSQAPNDLISGADLDDWRAQAHSFESLAGEGAEGRAVLRGNTSESVIVNHVTSNYFATLGQRIAVGRDFTASDEPGSRAVILSDRGWRQLFHADPTVVGRSVVLDGRQTAIVGVLDATNPFNDPADLYLAIDRASPDYRDRNTRSIADVVGRLRTGVSAATAQAEMQTVAARIARAYPDGRTGHRIHLDNLRDDYAGWNWRPLYFFLGASLVVLVLACANVANLLLARAMRRRREFAIRGALGGGLRALARQLLVEGGLLAVPAAALALLLTDWGLGLLATQIPHDYLARGTRVPLDVRACVFGLITAAFTAIVFGLVPAVFARRIDVNATLAGDARTAGIGRSQAHTRFLLLTAQIALTVVLLTGSALFLRSYLLLTQAPLGFDPAGRATARVWLSGARFSTDDDLRRYADEMVSRARTVPGVMDVAVETTAPLESGPLLLLRPPGGIQRPTDQPILAMERSIDPDYFATMGTPVIRGRAFTSSDTDGAPRVAIINQSLARRLFPHSDPIGQTIDILPRQHSQWLDRPGAATVVGVAANVRQIFINEVDLGEVCLPFQQAPAPMFGVVLRTTTDARSIVAPLRAAIGAIDRDVPITSATTFDQRVADALQADRFNLLVIAAFALVAVLIAAVGIYAALAYAVSERTREFGVRLALGARPGQVVASALMQAVRLGAAGGLLGLAAAFVLARVLGSALYLVPEQHDGLLFGVRTTDPLALASAFLLILVVAAIAGFVPARRVGRIDPMLALRE